MYLSNCFLLILLLAAACDEPATGDAMMNAPSDPIVVEQTFETPVAALWDAITNPASMPQWFFAEITDFEPRVGFQTQFTVTVEDTAYVHEWEVLEVLPERRIVYRWEYGGLPGTSTVTWELAEAPQGSRLTLTHSGHESFPQDDSVFNREAGLAGWRYFVQDSLKEFLEG